MADSHNISKRRRLRKIERVLLFRRADGFCQICGGLLSFDNFHADHKIPFVVTGRTVASEMQAACPKCNLKKGRRAIV